jgi:Flp pilus assembly protein TadB
VRLRPLIRPDPGGPRRPSRRDLVVFAGWLAAAAVYIGIGLYTVDFLLSFWVALAYALVVAWLVPSAVRRRMTR